MRKLLVIDDSSVTLNVIKMKLRADFDIVVASNGYTGQNMAKSERPDVILLDCVMEPLSGIDTLKALKSNIFTQGIPVVMMSIFEQEANIAALKEAGATEFVRKPLRPNDVDLLVKLANGGKNG